MPDNTYTIAVDFDGTLVTDKFPDIGEPDHYLATQLKNQQLKGTKLILWTCRAGAPLDAAVKFCRDTFGLVFDAVNTNLPEVIERWDRDTRKVFADEYWDDKAKAYKAMQGWEEVFADCVISDAPCYDCTDEPHESCVPSATCRRCGCTYPTYTTVGYCPVCRP